MVGREQDISNVGISFLKCSHLQQALDFPVTYFFVSHFIHKNLSNVIILANLLLHQHAWDSKHPYQIMLWLSKSNMTEKKETRNAIHSSRTQSIIIHLQQVMFIDPMQPEAIHKSVGTT